MKFNKLIVAEIEEIAKISENENKGSKENLRGAPVPQSYYYLRKDSELVQYLKNVELITEI